MKKEHAVCLKLEVLADAMLAGPFDLTSDYQRLAFAFASKSAKSYRAVLRLVENGLGEPALVLVRAVFDDLINLSYISTDPDRLAKLFLEFQLLEQKRYVDLWEESGLEGHVEAEEIARLKAQWAVAKSDYEKVLPNYPKRTYWSGKNVKAMAAAIDPELAKTYRLLYPYASGFAHGGSPLALSSYVGQTEDMNLTSLAAPSDAELSEALLAAFGLFSRCLRLFAAACEADKSGLDALNTEAEKTLS